MLLAVIGLFLMSPSPLSLAAFVAALAGLELHVRFVEEPYHLRTHGDDYARYAARVGRFLPYVGRRRD
jgi:protein-S-isoprenylcysteine O-methyltransferase Ste14